MEGYDVKISGASLAATYRDIFAEEVRNHGIEGLIDSSRARITKTTRGARPSTLEKTGSTPTQLKEGSKK